MPAIPGSCLCGGVRFEVEPPYIRASHCHCSRCRKHSGTYGEAQLRLPPEQLRVLAGEDLLRFWEPDDGGGRKVFCVRCGSSLFGAQWPDGEVVSVRLGAFDEDPGIRPEYRSWVSAAPAWLPLPDDGLPRHEEGVPAS
jgi:hypothetical protein